MPDILWWVDGNTNPRFRYPCLLGISIRNFGECNNYHYFVRNHLADPVPGPDLVLALPEYPAVLYPILPPLCTLKINFWWNYENVLLTNVPIIFHDCETCEEPTKWCSGEVVLGRSAGASPLAVWRYYLHWRPRISSLHRSLVYPVRERQTGVRVTAIMKKLLENRKN